MRQIKITTDLLKQVKDFNDNLFEARASNFEKPKTGLLKLKNSFSSLKHKKYVDYIDKIQCNYSSILNANPEYMKTLIEEFDNIISSEDVKKSNPHKKEKFFQSVVDAMRYEDLRNKEFPEYLLNSNIRTCVYCNSQSTLSMEKQFFGKKKRKVKSVIAKLQLDHFYPKSKYPFLSTSFFNLYPTCSNCNQAKSDKQSLFELYTLGDDLEVFKFKLDNKSALDYWMKLNSKNLKITLDVVNNNDALIRNHNELFQIQAIYDKQKDLGEELLWKAKINPKIYRKMLSENFDKIFHDQLSIDRLIIGNYSDPNEIFKRPMSKYTQDIARQLKLII